MSTHKQKTTKETQKEINITFPLIKLQNLIIRSELGEVWEGLCGDVKSAIRIVDWSNSKINHEEFQSEINELHKISSPNITLFLGACVHDNKVYICSEYSSRNLSTYLSNTNTTLAHRLELAHGAALGMRWLHSIKFGDNTQGVVHCHVKTSSFLIFEPELVKVWDFGLSSYWIATAASSKDAYNQLWMAPEVRSGRSGFTLASDVYSFGLVLLHVLTLRDPGTGATEIPEDAPLPLRKLIRACTDEDPAKRPNFEEITRNLEGMVFPDPDAREWWNSKFDGASKVSWRSFASEFEDAITKKVDGTPQKCENGHTTSGTVGGDTRVENAEDEKQRKLELQCLKELICEGEEVKMSKFGDTIDRLCVNNTSGEWKRVGSIAFEYFSKTWFHGYLSENSSVGFLGSCDAPKAFLIRFSSRTKGAFVISYKDGASGIKHVRVVHNNGKFEYNGESYDSLSEIVEKNKDLFSHPICHTHQMFLP